MEAPATRKVVEALSADGADVRFVGGCVRDARLGRETNDIDLGTPDRPERVMALLQRAGIESHTVPRGIEHGTVTALAGGKRHEITTLRRDEQTDGRHAEVAFTDDWREDAARRDFSFNAMSMTPDGTLHDYFGGQADLTAGRVRFVGDPATRIAEDHLRLLRFFRFHAWYGRGAPNEAALAACKAAAHTIPSLSGERVQTEMLRLLKAENPVPAVRAMRDTGVLAQLLPEVHGPERLARLVEIERKLDDTDPIRRLAALIVGSDDAWAAAKAVADRWRLAGTEGADLAALVAPSPEILTRDLTRRALRMLLYRFGPEQIRGHVLITWTDWIEDETVWEEILETAAAWERPTFPVTGADVLALGVEPGPKVGRLLAAVETWWMEQDFQPDRTAALAKLDTLIAERSEA